MARLLIKAVDYTHPDPDKDRRAAYKRGDVVVVMPDGHVWGGAEGPPKFVQMDVPGPAEDYTYLLTAPVDTPADMTSKAALRVPKIARLLKHVKTPAMRLRRRYSFDIDTQHVADKLRT